MSAPVEQAQVFTYLGMTFKAAADSYGPATGQVIAAITPVATAGVALYLTVMGYMIITGAVQESFYSFLKQSAKIMLVAAFALNVDTYVHAVVGTLGSLESGLLSALSLAGSDPHPNIYRTLDLSLTRGLNLVATCFEQVNHFGWTNMGTALAWFFAGVVVALSAIAMTLICGANIVIAKCALVVVFSIGPLFIMCLMWPATARFFDSWFSQVLNYTFTVVLSAAFMSFALAAFNRYLSDANFDDSAVNPVLASLQILLLGLVLGYLLLQVPSMASGLAGGMSLSSVSWRTLLTPLRAGQRALGALNAKSARRDLQTGHIEVASRGQHLIAGNTPLNPRYRQALLNGLGRNWGRAHGGKAEGEK
jgi:type IV secretion system protein VirB6